MSKFLTVSLFAIALAFAAQATPSYWAAAETTAAKGDTSAGGNAASYSAYYCTAATAASLFGGAYTVADITTYLTGNYDAGRQALEDSATKGGKTAEIVTASQAARLTSKDYVDGRYGLKSEYTASLATIGSEYLAMLFYDDGSTQEFRVMVNDPTDADSGNALFTDDPLASAHSAENSGVWTTAVVPEPTSGLLLLLGLAGLALRRRRADCGIISAI